MMRDDIPGHNHQTQSYNNDYNSLHNTSTQTRAKDAKTPFEAGRMIVGRDVILSGEVSSCAELLVEGTVKAELKDGRHVEITETGRFEGTLEVENAEISGFFEGTIRVTERLVLRPSAEIKGDMFYGMIEVHPGARIEGKMTALELPKIDTSVDETAEKNDSGKTSNKTADDHKFTDDTFEMDDIINRIAGEDGESDTTKTLPFRTAVNG